MEFTGLKCPVCGEAFKDGDDIVVCPECGTPHHRECYEIENRCAFYDKHGEDFEYNKKEAAEESDVLICPSCGASNAKDAFYCSKCGYSFNGDNNAQQNFYSSPFAASRQYSTAFDPMGGVDPSKDMGGGVTAGELSKFVKNNTPYFMRVFNGIKENNRSRFNFCAFIFSGFYLLYRKMYKLGGIIAAVMVALLIAETYIRYSPSYTALANAVQSTAATSTGGFLSEYSSIANAFQTIGVQDQAMLLIMAMCSLLRLLIQIFVALYANRWYFSHCQKQIKSIKETEENISQAIETNGGVNIALAVSMYAIYYGVTMIPMFI